MNRPLILVTGASGKIGRNVLNQLIERGYPVRALVRRRDDRSDALARLGADIAVADLSHKVGVQAAMAGVQRAFFLPPFHQDMMLSGRNFAEAVKTARLESVTVLSQWLASPEHPSAMTRMHAEIDQLFSSIPDTAHVTVAPGYFADNYLRLIDFAVHLGVLPNLTGESRNAPPSNEDIARVVVETLIDPKRHNGQIYRPTGPELLSTPDIAEILSGLLGHRVRAVPMPFLLLVKAARLQGVPAFDLASLAHYVKDHRQGAFEWGAPNDHVLRVTGKPAESLAVTAARYAALPIAQPSLRRRLRTLFDFLRTPLSPGYDLRKAEQSALAPPPPAKPLLAMENPDWRQRTSEETRPVRLIA